MWRRTFSSMIMLLLSMWGMDWAVAHVYQSTDRHGNVTFSDTPSRGAKSLNVLPPQTFTPPVNSPQPKPANYQPQRKQVSYRSIRIIYPEHEATLRDNSGNMLVSLITEPPLQDGDKIQLLLDGRKIGDPLSSLSFSLRNVDRGTHELQAQLINNQGELLLSSDKVIFFMHQARITPAGIRSHNLYIQERIKDYDQVASRELAKLREELKKKKKSTDLTADQIRKYLSPRTNAAIAHVQRKTPKDYIRQMQHGDPQLILQGQTPNFQQQGSIPSSPPSVVSPFLALEKPKPTN